MKNRLVPLLLGAVFALGACSAAPSEGPSGTTTPVPSVEALPEAKVGSELVTPTARVSLDKVEIAVSVIGVSEGVTMVLEDYVLYLTLTNTTDESQLLSQWDCSKDWLWFSNEDTSGQMNGPNFSQTAMACSDVVVEPGESIEIQEYLKDPTVAESFVYLMTPSDTFDRGEAQGRFVLSPDDATMIEVGLGEEIGTPYGGMFLDKVTPRGNTYELQGTFRNGPEVTLANLCNGDPVWYSATDDTGRPMSEKKFGQEECEEILPARDGNWESVISGVGPDTDALYLMTADPSGEKMRTLGKVRLTQ